MADKSSSNSSYSKRNVWSGVLFGIGLMALIDEIIFHQLLQWHHFYDHSTTQVGIFSDGILNAFALFAVVGGLFMLADLHRKNVAHMKVWAASLLMGAGGFQLVDGLINHKLLRVHQVRYDVEHLWLYDLAWNGSGAVLLIAGIIFFIRAKRRTEE